MSEPIPIDRTLEISLVNDLPEIAGVAARIDEFCEGRSLPPQCAYAVNLAIDELRIDEFCEGRSLPPQCAYAVNLAIDELLTDAITSGYGDDDPHRVESVLR